MRFVSLGRVGCGSKGQPLCLMPGEFLQMMKETVTIKTLEPVEKK